jgi:hypothetical protein
MCGYSPAEAAVLGFLRRLGHGAAFCMGLLFDVSGNCILGDDASQQ